MDELKGGIARKESFLILALVWKNGRAILLVMQQISEFRNSACECWWVILSFIIDRISLAERDAETMALAIYLAQQSVNSVRVHNVEMCARGLNAYLAVKRGPSLRGRSPGNPAIYFHYQSDCVKDQKQLYDRRMLPVSCGIISIFNG